MTDRPPYRPGWLGACEQMAADVGVSVDGFVDWGAKYVERHGRGPSKAETVDELARRIRMEATG